MFKATMRDNLGWMKDKEVITGSIIELMKFINYYAKPYQDVTLDNIKKLELGEEYILCTADGLKLTIKNK